MFLLTYLLFNNATLWPPTLFAFTEIMNGGCPQNIFEEYHLLGVNQTKYLKQQHASMKMCATYTPDLMIWEIPQIYDIKRKLILQCELKNNTVSYWVENRY